MRGQPRDRYDSRWALWLTLAIVALLTIRIASVWSELPDSMASHFGASGQPDAFMSKAGFFIFMALIGGGTVLILFVTPSFLFRLPKRLINLPNPDYWLANDERRTEGLRRMSWFLGWMGMGTAALIAASTELVLRANLYRRGLENGPFFVILVLYFVFVIGGLILQFRALAVPED